ncbi:MAG: helix-hairpin-helix domain-containing protein [Halieaceae bacterium]|jgi:DNA uptake protein ComE-like DNA-binding protein|nr:helix-hairpin-helix domain-containing protein [Halieaceae bacterium]
MDFDSLLLILIAWLLWTIHQDLTESNDRARSLKTTVNQLLAKLESGQRPRDVLGTSAAEEVATVNINTASKARLQTLPRIGAVTAQHIIDGRPYQTVEALRQVPGINNAIFGEIQGKVSV